MNIFRKSKELILAGVSTFSLKMGHLFKVMRVNINKSPYRYSVLKRNFELKKLIENQRVLIIGSGMSANELKYIPKDVKILTCNFSPRLLLDKGICREIDLYYCALGVLDKGSKNENIIDLLLKLKINLFIIYNPKLIRKFKDLRKNYTKCIKDRGSNNYYLDRLLGPQEIDKITNYSLANNSRTSTGVRLLQYALYFKAKEIYLIGIDVNEDGYFWGKNNTHEHLCIDKSFIEIVSKKYSNIYSAAENSPIVRYIKYKPLV